MQRTTLIGIIAVVILVIGGAVYFIFGNKSAGVAISPTGGGGLPVAGQGVPPSTGGQALPTGTQSPTGTPTIVSARLVQITTGPVVPGEVLINTKPVVATSTTATTTPDVLVSYIARESGNVFSYLVKAHTLTRISNRTLPGIQSADWLPDGSFAFVRYLSGADFSTINTYALPSNGTGGFFLPQNLSGVAVSPTGVITLSSGVNGSSASLSRIDGTHSSLVFTTPLSALRISFAGKNQYLAFTKPTMTLPGFAYLVDGAGNFSKITDSRNGLVARASPSGKWVLVSSATSGSMNMELINTATGVSLPLPVATIADKCVWASNDSVIYCGVPQSPSSSFSYPDDWYQGAVAFSDRLWKIDVSSRFAQLVLDFPKETQGQLDAEALSIDPSGTTLVFVNKNDGSLWSYQL